MKRFTEGDGDGWVTRRGNEQLALTGQSSSGIHSVNGRVTGQQTHGDRSLERTEIGCTWTQLERVAQDRGSWRDIVGGLCSRRRNGRTKREGVVGKYHDRSEIAKQY